MTMVTFGMKNKMTYPVCESLFEAETRLLENVVIAGEIYTRCTPYDDRYGFNLDNWVLIGYTRNIA